MKYTGFYLLVTFLAIGCTPTHLKEQSLNETPLLHSQFEEYILDSAKILYPHGIFSFQDYVILIEKKNNPVLSFWTPDSLKYQFSSGYIGGGPNELINPRANYFSSSDSSFYLLDSNIEREMSIENEAIHILNNVPITLPDAINQLVHIKKDYYILSGMTDGSSQKEHFIYADGMFTPFGEYPSTGLEDMEQAQFDFKFTAGRAGKNVFYDFYAYHNLIRKYSIEGELLEETQLGGIPENNNTYSKYQNGEAAVFWNMVTTTDDYIYALFYGDITRNQLYDKGGIPELQVWDWEGKLKKRILFDKVYDIITVSKKGILYALNTLEPYKVYVSDMSLN